MSTPLSIPLRGHISISRILIPVLVLLFAISAHAETIVPGEPGPDSSVRKITLDKVEQHFLEERSTAIQNAYKKLTTKDIEINFDKEPHYYTLKQGEKQK